MTQRYIKATLVAILFSFFLVSCGGGSSSDSSGSNSSQVDETKQEDETTPESKSSQIGFGFSTSQMTLEFGASSIYQIPLGQLSDRAMVYESSDEAVATINAQGLITIRGVGEVTIKAIAPEDDKYLRAESSFKLVVGKAEQEDFSFSTDKIFVSDLQTEIKQIPTGQLSEGAVSYQTSNSAIATVDSAGKITLTGYGVVTITATAPADGSYLAAEATYELTYKASPTAEKLEQTSFTFSKSAISATYGDTNIQYIPQGQLSNAALTYQSNDTSIATVDTSGKVTTVKPGQVKIDAIALADAVYNVAQSSYQLTINKAEQTGFGFSTTAVRRLVYSAGSTTTELAEGGQSTGQITYQSSNTAVATVNAQSGEVTLKGLGKATISATKASNEYYLMATASYPLEAIAATQLLDPVASAGDDQTVKAKDIVQLKGSASSDQDGNIVSYLWEQTSGFTVSLTQKDQSNSGFIAPEFDTKTNLIFKLTVTDNDGKTDSDTVTISVDASISNQESSDASPTISLELLPKKDNYQPGDQVAILAKSIDDQVEVSKVEIFINDKVVQTSTQPPYQHLWTTSQGVHNLKAVATTSSNQTSQSVLNNINVSTTQLSTSAFAPSLTHYDTVGNDWQRMVLKVTNNSSKAIDVNNAEIIYTLPSAYDNHSFSMNDSGGAGWIASDNFIRYSVAKAGGNTEHHIKLVFADSSSKSLGAGRSMYYRVHGFSTAIPSTLNGQITGSLKFYIKDEVPTDYATLSINAPLEPGDTLEKAITVYVTGGPDKLSLTQQVAWGKSYDVINLVSGGEYKVWTNSIQNGKKFFASNVTQENPLTFTADKDNVTQVSIGFTQSTIADGSLSLSFTGIPTSAQLNIDFVSQRSEDSDKSFGALATNQSHTLTLDEGVYNLRVNDFRDPETGKYYIAQIPDSLEISGASTNLALDFRAYDFGPVAGLPPYLAMGSISEASVEQTTRFKQAKLDMLFYYAGYGGNGDRGHIVPASRTLKAITQTRAMDTEDQKIMPMMVVYTAEASGGGWAENDIVVYDNLVKHHINLIRITRALQSNVDAEHPFGGGIILNPDLFGELQKKFEAESGWGKDGSWQGSLVDDAEGYTRERIVRNTQAVKEAIEYAIREDGAPRIDVPNFEENLFGFFQATNYLIRSYGPKVVFGWQQNLWSTGTAHNLRYANTNSNVKAQIVDPTLDFWNHVRVYDGLWKPDFITFDKYERDDFDHRHRLDWVYNGRDWDRYLYLVDEISKGLNVPALLWQIPGGHMPTIYENLGDYDVNVHSSASGPYFFGDDRITEVDDIHPSVLALDINQSDDRIYNGATSVGEYLRSESHDWSQPNLDKTIASRVFGILWGGGNTTAVMPLTANGTGGDGYDNGWLLEKVNQYHENPLPLMPFADYEVPEPSAQTISTQSNEINTEVNKLLEVSFLGVASTKGIQYRFQSGQPTNLLDIVKSESTPKLQIKPLKSGTTKIEVYATADDLYKQSNVLVLTFNIDSIAQPSISLTQTNLGNIEAGESASLIVSGGAGEGDFVAEVVTQTSADDDAISLSFNKNTLRLNYLKPSQDTINIRIKKSSDEKYLESNTVTLKLKVIASTKAAQSAISVSQSSLSKEVGASASLTLSGGSGSGKWIIQTQNSAPASVSLDSNTLQVSFKKVGTTTYSIFKEGDDLYIDSNKVNVQLTTQADATQNADDISLEATATSDWSIQLDFTNPLSRSLNLKGASLVVQSPFSLTSGDYKVINGATSWTSVSTTSVSKNGLYESTIVLNFTDGIDYLLEADAKFSVVFYPGDTTTVDLNLFKLVGFIEGSSGGGTQITSSSLLQIKADPVDLNVPGWGECLSMGTVTDTSSQHNQDFADAKVGAIFKYAGDGFGDRDQILTANAMHITQTIDQARAIEALRGDGSKVMPVIVFYTADGSTGEGTAVAAEDIKDEDIMFKHLVNLIRTARYLQSQKDAQHPNPGSIILNPDLLGQWLVNEKRTPNNFEVEFGGTSSDFVALPVRDALVRALNYVVTEDGAVQTAVPQAISDDILGYIQMHNFIIRHFAPDVTFGWQQNLWPLSEVGSANWVHDRFSGNQHLWDEVTLGAFDFLERMKVYQGDWKPDFLAIDKYERDGFGAGKGAYAYNSLDWQNYLLFVKQLTDALDTPAMLWQIPGGHMVTNNEIVTNYDIVKNSASGGPFFMGDKEIGSDLTNIDDRVKDIALDSSVYGVNNVGDYLAEDASFDWGADHLRQAAFSNVFAILWGGGDTTAVVTPIVSTGDDDNWLQNKVVSYYNNGCTQLYPKNSSGGFTTTGISDNDEINKVLLDESKNYDTLFKVLDNDNKLTLSSNIYKWEDFLTAVRTMHQKGVGDLKIWLGEDEVGVNSETRAKYGLVSLAAFLAQSMQETIQYDVCDENNWSDIKTINDEKYSKYYNGVPYPMTAACGQVGQDYSSYGANSAISCPLDPKMEISAITHAKWWGAPGPLFGAPDSALEYQNLLVGGKVGAWSSQSCSVYPSPARASHFELKPVEAYLRGECEIYVNQDAGLYQWNGSGTTYKNSGSGVLSPVDTLENCVWWGRGIIQTTGRQNFGLLNHYLGRTHIDKSNTTLTSEYPVPDAPLYPHLDFCSNPELICSSEKHKELKWIAGLFYWMVSMQNYEGTAEHSSWKFKDRVKEFVDGGMTDPNFINEVSGVVNRGCPALTCDAGEVHEAGKRKANFEQVLRAMDLIAAE